VQSVSNLSDTASYTDGAESIIPNLCFKYKYRTFESRVASLTPCALRRKGKPENTSMLLVTNLVLTTCSRI